MKSASYAMRNMYFRPMHKVKLDEAQRRLPELVQEAVRGEDVVISRGDGAGVRLVPVGEAPGRARKGGGLKGQFTVPEAFDDLPPEFSPYT